jgi:PIN domain nuclease of toxin-antitoxin system
MDTTDTLTRPADTRTAAEALLEAATTAGYAPSIHNTQPWRWRITGDTVDLHLVRSRIPATADPDGRLATLSGGAALHHARVTMAARGWQITVTRMLQGADRDLLARLHVHHKAPIDRTSAMLLRTILSRYNYRRAVPGTPPGPEALTAITAAIEAQGTRLHTLRPDQVLELATGRDHRDPSDLPIIARRDKAEVFVMLYGSADEPLNWLRAGEALSAGWLTATGRGVSFQQHCAPIDRITTRQALRALIAGTGYPYLLLRLGTIDPADAGMPRPPVDQIIERY